MITTSGMLVRYFRKYSTLKKYEEVVSLSNRDFRNVHSIVSLSHNLVILSNSNSDSFWIANKDTGEVNDRISNRHETSGIVFAVDHEKGMFIYARSHIELWKHGEISVTCVKLLDGHGVDHVITDIKSTSFMKILTSGTDSCVRMWDLEKGTNLRTFEFNNPVRCITIVSESDFWAGDDEGYCKKYDVNSGKLEKQVNLGERVNFIQHFPEEVEVSNEIRERLDFVISQGEKLNITLNFQNCKFYCPKSLILVQSEMCFDRGVLDMKDIVIKRLNQEDLIRVLLGIKLRESSKILDLYQIFERLKMRKHIFYLCSSVKTLELDKLMNLFCKSLLQLENYKSNQIFNVENMLDDIEDEKKVKVDFKHCLTIAK